MRSPRRSTRRGLTLLEMAVTMATLAVLAIVVVPPALQNGHAKSGRIRCLANLKSIGLGLRTFSSDHDGKFPMDLPVALGGTHEHVSDADQLWRHWAALSGGLASPTILLCPDDLARQRTRSYFSGTTPATTDPLKDNHHISYFLGLNASEADPQSILAGDRNLTTNAVPVGPGRLVLTDGMVVGFTSALHNGSGNILFGDGSVQQMSGDRLHATWHDAATRSKGRTNVWLVP